MKEKMEHETTQFEGAIPLRRKFFKHPFWTEKRMFSKAEAWIDLLKKARYREDTEEIIDRGESIFIAYAQILTSELTLAHDWNRSRVWVKKRLDYLEKNHSIKFIQRNKRRTIIEIVNMRHVKNTLQQHGQQNEQQTIQEKSNTTTDNNKVNKDNNSKFNGNAHKINTNTNAFTKGFESVQDTLKNKAPVPSNHITTPHQEEAFRLANQLRINLDDLEVRNGDWIGRWVKVFKDASNSPAYKKKVMETYSYLSDYLPFVSISSSVGKIKYFFTALAHIDEFRKINEK